MTTVTTWIIIGTSLVWIVWDIVLYVRSKNDPKTSTISMIITKFSWYSPILPFIVGLLAGHWFWPS